LSSSFAKSYQILEDDNKKGKRKLPFPADVTAPASALPLRFNPVVSFDKSTPPKKEEVRPDPRLPAI